MIIPEGCTETDHRGRAVTFGCIQMSCAMAVRGLAEWFVSLRLGGWRYMLVLGRLPRQLRPGTQWYIRFAKWRTA